MKRYFLLITTLALAGPAIAHHGWGSYDAAHPVTVTGPILTLKYENPHATIAVKGADKEWIVTLAPTSRMSNRGVTPDVVATGKTVMVSYDYAAGTSVPLPDATRTLLQGLIH